MYFNIPGQKLVQEFCISTCFKDGNVCIHLHIESNNAK